MRRRQTEPPPLNADYQLRLACPVVETFINVNPGLNNKEGWNFAGLKCPYHVN